jgi:hypothetical protein
MTLARAAAATPQAPGSGLAPLLLAADLRLSPQQFALVCAANPGAVLELTADGLVADLGAQPGGEDALTHAYTIAEAIVLTRAGHCRFPAWGLRPAG